MKQNKKEVKKIKDCFHSFGMNPKTIHFDYLHANVAIYLIYIYRARKICLIKSAKPIESIFFFFPGWIHAIKLGNIFDTLTDACVGTNWNHTFKGYQFFYCPFISQKIFVVVLLLYSRFTTFIIINHQLYVCLIAFPKYSLKVVSVCLVRVSDDKFE